MALVVEAWAGLRRDDAAISEPRQRIAAMLCEGASAGPLSASQPSLIDRGMHRRQATVESEMVPWSRARPLGVDWARARIRPPSRPDRTRGTPWWIAATASWARCTGWTCT
jgi:hypothetical protein